MAYYLAEFNVARMKGTDINDPIMKEFADNVERINSLAERSEGFIWRFKDDIDLVSVTGNPEDEQVIYTLSVWQSVESLEQFMYKTVHADYLKRRKEWFHNYGKISSALWWVTAGQMPTLPVAVDKLALLQEHGPCEQVFHFKSKYPQPT